MHFISSCYLKILYFGGILFLGIPSKAAIPILEVVQEGPDISLVWNDTGEHWILETSLDCGLSTQWEFVDQQPVLADGFFSVPVQVAAHRQYFRLRFDESDPPGFASIPGGTFMMGRPAGEPGGESDEGQHEVTISAFLMKKHEVTNQELLNVLNWAEDAGKLTVTTATVTNAEGTSHKDLVELDDLDCRILWNAVTDSFEMKNVAYADHPAVAVSWYGALAWCNYQSDRGGLNRCYSFNDWSCDWTKSGYRLPTESEWEYACRAGTTTAFYTGDLASPAGSDPNMDAAGWYANNSGSSTHAVGDPSKTANAWGLYDMHGNLEEWCWDWYGIYPAGPITDSRGPASGTYRVFRGGSWSRDPRHCRAASRNYDTPGSTVSGRLGFRVARSSSP